MAECMAATCSPDQYVQYAAKIKELRETEFSHASGVTYLDHAGTTLYSRQQLQAHMKDLTSSLYGNPHSHTTSSRLTSDCIEHARELVLKHFGTGLHQYDVIFTSGCTAALKLLAETFPWSARRKEMEEKEEVVYIESPDILSTFSAFDDKNREEKRSFFCYLEDNHTSVLGMREVASASGAGLVCVSSTCLYDMVSSSETACISSKELNHAATQTTPHSSAHAYGTISPFTATSSTSLISSSMSFSSTSFSVPFSSSSTASASSSSSTSLTHPLHLFVYPGQSNFNGRKYPLSWITDISQRHLKIPGCTNILGTWLVALDAAALVATNPLNLSNYPAHFVAVSFYKIFGFPTGLGALLVKRDCCPLLGLQHEKSKRSNYFGGGTVLASIACQRFHIPRSQAHDRLEYGTVSFLDILALKHGFEALGNFGLSPVMISHHTFLLAQYTYTNMAEMKHSNGRQVCVLYHHNEFNDPCEQGGVVTFNLMRPDGSYVGYSEVDKLACSFDIHVRTGCFCNPGSCQRSLKLSNEHLMRNIQAGHSCGDNIDLVAGQPTGCVRVSFGYMSTKTDAEMFVNFVSKCFIDLGVDNTDKGKMIREEGGKEVNSIMKISGSCGKEVGASLPSCDITSNYVKTTCMSDNMNKTDQSYHHKVICCGDLVTAVDSSDVTMERVLERVILYPVKSCSGFEVKAWPVGPKGLLYDREWMVVSEQGYCVTQKQKPVMARLCPKVDLYTGTLTITMKGSDLPEIIVHPSHANCEETREENSEATVENYSLCHTRVCGDRIQGQYCGREVSEWLSHALGTRCNLVRQGREERKREAGGVSVPLSLSNEAQYLMVTLESVRHFHHLLSGVKGMIHLPIDDLLLRFRPNLVVGENKEKKDKKEDEEEVPFCEDDWKAVTIGSNTLQVTGKCSRCQIVCVDQSSGDRHSQPLQSLLSIRGSKAQFGIYLATI